MTLVISSICRFDYRVTVLAVNISRYEKHCFPEAIYYFGILVINDLFNFGLKGVCIPLNNHRLCHVLLWALKYNDDSCQNANQMLL